MHPLCEAFGYTSLRHTFAVLLAGVHFMQVSKWLGDSTFNSVAGGLSKRARVHNVPRAALTRLAA